MMCCVCLLSVVYLYDVDEYAFSLFAVWHEP